MPVRIASQPAAKPEVDKTIPQGASPGSPPDWVLACALALIVAALYVPRMTDLTIRGEESGWALVGLEMEATGDWCVPRLQGTPYVERPPLGSWLMVVASWCTGGMNLLAVRLPSVLATVALSLVIFAYGRNYLTSQGAFAAGLIYASMGQVLILGRLGESEAVFTLLLCSSLLVWHWGYSSGWPRLAFWTAGYTLAGLAALTKGLQALFYFGAATVAFLLLRRDWRTLFSPAHFAGLTSFVILVGAWALPFYQRTDARAFLNIWTGLVRDRVHSHGLWKHVLTYPFETFASTLPWSLAFLLPLLPRFRPMIQGGGQHVAFLLTAVAATYPSVWFVAEARNRYYMPMYPCLALVAALIWANWAGPAGDTLAAHLRRRLTWLNAGGVALAALAVGIVGLGSWELPELLEEFRPTPVSASIVLVLGLAAAACLVTVAGQEKPYAGSRALLAWVLLMGLSYTILAMDVQVGRSADLSGAMAEIRARIGDAPLLSFGPVRHRFQWYYADKIPQIPWPDRAEEIPPGIEYFCFDHHPGDTPERRRSGRGRDFVTTKGTLPFAWERVYRFDGDSWKNGWASGVIVGRILRDVDPRTTQSRGELRR